MMREQPRRTYTCEVCGGPAHRRTNVATHDGMEDADQPLLHTHRDDWFDHPHRVVIADEQEATA